MKILNYKNVTVFKHFRSKRATGIYKYAVQRKPLGDIDLRGVSNGKMLNELWICTITDDGIYSLTVKDNKGRFAKSLGNILVTDGKVRIDSKKSGLSKYIESNRLAEERRNKFIRGR